MPGILGLKVRALRRDLSCFSADRADMAVRASSVSTTLMEEFGVMTPPVYASTYADASRLVLWSHDAARSVIAASVNTIAICLIFQALWLQKTKLANSVGFVCNVCFNW